VQEDMKKISFFSEASPPWQGQKLTDSRVKSSLFFLSFTQHWNLASQSQSPNHG